MVSTISTTGLDLVPDVLVVAIGEFVEGALTITDLCGILAVAVEEYPESGEAVQELLDDELQARRLSVADYGELVTMLGAILSENVPTEWSEDAPDEPGTYNFADKAVQLPDPAPEIAAIIAAEADTGSHRMIGSEKIAPATSRLELEPDVPEAALSERAEAAGAGLQMPAETAQAGHVQQDAGGAMPAVIGSVLCARFRIEQEVAHGSMGVVYKATDLHRLQAEDIKPYVAIKLINPGFINHSSALQTFENEIANARHLSHPNIIQLYDLEQDHGRYFISMEWLEGESLDALLDRSKGSALPPVQAYAIIEQLCDALAYAHEQNIVHADVKPGNVFLTSSGELKLIDFGIARTCAASMANSDQESAVALTPAYASCERLEKAEPTAQDDLYSLAALIFRLLSGRRVFGTMTALEGEQLKLKPVRIGGMNDARWNALVAALAFRRADRPGSVREFAAAFGSCLELPEQASGADADLIHTTTMTLLAEDESAAGMDLDVDFALEAAADELHTIRSAQQVSDDLAEESSGQPGFESLSGADMTVDDSAAGTPETHTEAAQTGAIQAQTPLGSGRDAQPVAAGVQPVKTSDVAESVIIDGPISPAAERQRVAEKLQQSALQLRLIQAGRSIRYAALNLFRTPRGALLVFVLATVTTWLVLSAGQDEKPVAVTVAPEFDTPGVLPVQRPLAETAEPETDSVDRQVDVAGEQKLVAEAESETETDNDPAGIKLPVAIPADDVAVVAVESAPLAPATVQPVVAAKPVPQPEPAPKPVRKPVNIGELNRKTQMALGEGRLLEPADDNAALWLGKMRQQDPRSPLVTTAVDGLVARAIGVADAAVRAGDADKAARYVELAVSNGAAGSDIENLQQMVMGMRKHRAWPAVAAADSELLARKLMERESSAGQGSELFKLVPLSALDFVYYSQPKYPGIPGESPVSGWVDLQFAVNSAGRVSNIRILGSNLPDRFAAPAREAVSKWRFRPYAPARQSVEVDSAVRLRFVK